MATVVYSVRRAGPRALCNDNLIQAEYRSPLQCQEAETAKLPQQSGETCSGLVLAFLSSSETSAWCLHWERVGNHLSLNRGAAQPYGHWS